MTYEPPYIHEVANNHYIVRTTTKAIWYSGDNFLCAIECCRTIERLHEAYREVESMINKWSERLKELL